MKDPTAIYIGPRYVKQEAGGLRPPEPVEGQRRALEVMPVSVEVWVKTGRM